MFRSVRLDGLGGRRGALAKLVCVKGEMAPAWRACAGGKKISSQGVWAKSITVGEPDAVLLFSFLFFFWSVGRFNCWPCPCRHIFGCAHLLRHYGALTLPPFYVYKHDSSKWRHPLEKWPQKETLFRCSLTMKGRNTPTSFLHRRKCNDPPFTDRPGCHTCIFLNSYRIGPPTQRSIPPFI